MSCKDAVPSVYLTVVDNTNAIFNIISFRKALSTNKLALLNKSDFG